MPTIPEAFPRRPLKIALPRPRRARGFWALFGILFLLGSAAAIAAWAIPPLISDLAIRDTARPVRGRIENGKCHSKIVFHICDLTLVNDTARPTIRRDVTYVFTDFHIGDYAVSVMADRAHPDWLTTDLALDQLTSRILTMAGAAALVLFGFIAWLRQFFRRERLRAAIRAVSGQILTPVPLTLTAYGANKTASTWLVRRGAAAPVRWSFPATAKPFTVGTPTAILGVTGPKDDLAIPLDANLQWLDLTDTERAAIRAAAQS